MITSDDWWVSDTAGSAGLGVISTVWRIASHLLRNRSDPDEYLPDPDSARIAPTEPASDLRLLTVLVVVGLLIALIALVIALIALVIGQRNHTQPSAHPRWLADGVELLPTQNPVVQIGYPPNYQHSHDHQ